MISYEEIKNWLKERENKNKLVLGACFVLVFLVGFGTGKFEKEIRKPPVQNNYTTNSVSKATVEGGAGEQAKQENIQVLGDITPDTASSSTLCVIKGNVSSSGLIYHVKGGSFYDRTDPEMCFNTEAEAQAAGFRKSSR
ncbi:MAG: hypothetical protein COT92_02740 [Candidatus Doudnabacteria bacterium CG10_big_fil_rev_8_21_14_0_10_42_18]|uniref:Ada DNA repair metal-binding domain-containing protein n=1 Tax=Candidatus Doudnabacteria bacterium CG10_big_fil_rev_8_21_14_0_10_42_18 TaxID=1974552 RepID=A0A2H0VCX5_9BACT|nr:MAG: hypothetical protein COT92_02740 [Candidatus Doudnabacteria bacterium CG10_big_fil_rev_8_21_14_0_10_42_18]